MGCCCEKIYQGFCEIDTCAPFESGLVAQVAGEHSLHFNFLGIGYSKTKEFALGAELNFELDKLNENAEVVAQLKAPDGTVIGFMKDEIEYDCFVIKRRLNYAV